MRIAGKGHVMSSSTLVALVKEATLPSRIQRRGCLPQAVAAAQVAVNKDATSFESNDAVRKKGNFQKTRYRMLGELNQPFLKVLGSGPLIGLPLKAHDHSCRALSGLKRLKQRVPFLVVSCHCVSGSVSGSGSGSTAIVQKVSWWSRKPQRSGATQLPRTASVISSCPTSAVDTQQYLRAYSRVLAV